MNAISGTEDTALDTGHGVRSGDLVPRLAIGQRVDRYDVLEFLGAGAMGEVYRARDSRLNRDIALKLVRAIDTPGASCGLLCSLLMKEAQSLARLSHSGLLTVHDVGEHQGCAYVAMQLLDGVTLREWVATHDEPWRARLELLLAAGEAIAAAHGAKIIHRDIKPDNILVERDRHVVVTDFGLARSLADFDDSTGYACGCAGGQSVSIALDGMAVGTPRYMSPEQHDGRAADGRSDQFSFAVTAWEVLHGTPPFAGETIKAIRQAIAMQSLTPPLAHGPLPGQVSALLARGMREQPSARFPNMTSFVKQLRAAAE
jgi:serine/threonine protein kinase